MKITPKKIVKAFIPYGFIALYHYFRARFRFTWLMTENEQKTFRKYVKEAKRYLEFGSGGSTIAALTNTEGNIYSIESSKAWIELMRKKYGIIAKSEINGHLKMIYGDIGPTKGIGAPIILCDEEEKDFDRFLNYSQRVFKEYPEIKTADVVLIDGRFRVACCLSVLLKVNSDAIIMIHDFWNRPQYHVLKKFVIMIERVDSMIVCKKNRNVSDNEIEQEYERYKYTSE